MTPYGAGRIGTRTGGAILAGNTLQSSALYYDISINFTQSTLMRYILFLLSVIMLGTVACKKKNYLGDINTEYVYYTSSRYVNNARIVKDTAHPQYYPYTNTKRSGGVVFYYSVMKDVKNGSEGYYDASLRFQADSGVSSFSYKDSVLAQKMTIFSSGEGGFAYALTVPMTLLYKGTISGTRQPDSSWIVDIHVLLPQFDPKIRMYRIDTTVHITEGNYLH
ncbi:MAG: hypothetical protein JST82_05125 [Bacteroidetes bacterium]|nr:hypothetical protein [Bacteroidota bacterium]